MNAVLASLRNYPAISKWLGPWLQQLGGMGRTDDYRVILGELEELQSGIAQEQHDENLRRLDYHLCVASNVSRNFDSVLSERPQLGSDLYEANRTILDKLAEIRAIVGLHRLDFEDIEFIKTPDLLATFKGKRFLVEVTRLGASAGMRSDVWDEKLGSIREGIEIDVSWSEKKPIEALSDAIYREIEDKYPQFKKSKHQADGFILCISLGRDYFTAGRYELPNVALRVIRSNTSTKRALALALQQIGATGLYSDLSHVVLSVGRDEADLLLPELNTDAKNQ
jgi:hypothetical protein